jgi:hypothetical protein
MENKKTITKNKKSANKGTGSRWQLPAQARFTPSVRPKIKVNVRGQTP